MKKYLPIVLLALSSLGSLLAMTSEQASEKVRGRLQLGSQQSLTPKARFSGKFQDWKEQRLQENTQFRNAPTSDSYTHDYQPVPQYFEDHGSITQKYDVPSVTEQPTAVKQSPSPTQRNSSPKQQNKGTLRGFFSKNKK